MRRLELTPTDIAFANRMLSDDSIYPFISDDYANPKHRYISAQYVLQNPAIVMLAPNQWTLFMILPRTMTIYEVHTMVMPEGRGLKAVKAGKQAAKWMFENTTCEKLVGYVPVDHPAMLLYSRLVGFKQEGLCTKSWKKNGQLIDQAIFGLEKEALCLP